MTFVHIIFSVKRILTPRPHQLLMDLQAPLDVALEHIVNTLVVWAHTDPITSPA